MENYMLLCSQNKKKSTYYNYEGIKTLRSCSYAYHSSSLGT